MNEDCDPHFVFDGYERARGASIDQVWAEVELEFAERWAAAGWFERLKLKREMQREIERRLDRVAPPWGLYISD